MGRALEQVTRLEMFPKVFGTLAVVSGAVLFWLGSYGPFLQAWIAGSLLLFIAVEVLVVGFLNPAAGCIKRCHGREGSFRNIRHVR